ncbi:hypothetical protein KVT40_005735 [Elsinoe batatas]|uniref:Uncharacterized protein n=1 Tax=Elsinoe batatas TaxID=2601811 RepID=A0A8K0PCD6_9PEZI|nr:hypothetical protein KVT40_005735 [Elsinoe batatas]
MAKVGIGKPPPLPSDHTVADAITYFDSHRLEFRKLKSFAAFDINTVRFSSLSKSAQATVRYRLQVSALKAWNETAEPVQAARVAKDLPAMPHGGPRERQALTELPVNAPHPEISPHPTSRPEDDEELEQLRNIDPYFLTSEQLDRLGASEAAASLGTRFSERDPPTAIESVLAWLDGAQSDEIYSISMTTDEEEG